MQLNLRALSSFGAICFFLVSGAVLAAPAQKSIVSIPNPLAKAKTASVRELFLEAGKDGKLSQIVTFDVLTSKPSSARVLLRWKGDGKRYGLYVGDEKSGNEYNGLTNTYQPTDKFPDGRIRSELRDISSADLVLNGPHPGDNAKFEELNGKSALVYSQRQALRDPGKFVETAVYIDAKTGLPIKKCINFIDGQTSSPAQEFDFEDWKLNISIAPKQFVFSPPSGAKAYEAPKLLASGSPVPSLKAQFPDGSDVDLSKYRGKILIIDLWATWCGPCQNSMPHLQKVYDETKNQNVDVLAVCVWDQKDAFDKWVAAKKNQYTFPVAFDPQERNPGNVGTLFDAPGIPAQFVVDPDGKIASSLLGYSDGDHKLEDALAKLGVKFESQK